MSDFNKLGSFQKGIYSAVPYRHHQARMLWHVEVIKRIDEEEYHKRGMRVIAMNAHTACLEAIKAYQLARDMESVYWKERMAKKVSKRELKASSIVPIVSAV